MTGIFLWNHGGHFRVMPGLVLPALASALPSAFLPLAGMESGELLIIPVFGTWGVVIPEQEFRYRNTKAHRVRSMPEKESGRD
jgi:hypothetical protein